LRAILRGDPQSEEAEVGSLLIAEFILGSRLK
jgi:hypothetical protein